MKVLSPEIVEDMKKFLSEICLIAGKILVMA